MEGQSPYRIELLVTLAQLDALQEDWTDLINAVPNAPVFLTWEWIRTWWLHFGKGRDLWLLAARDAHGRLLGLAPLMREQLDTGWMRLRGITFIGTGLICPVHLNILARAADEEGIWRAFLDFLFRQSDQWDVACFQSVARESVLNDLSVAAQGNTRMGSHVTSPYLPLPSSWGCLLTTLNKRLRRNLRYFRSKLEDRCPGSVVFTCVTESRELSGAMERLEGLSRTRWHAQGASSAFDDPDFSAFHQAIACLAFDRGWLRLYQLKVLGRVIALFYCFRFHDRIYAYQTGFDMEWRRYSPGRLLIAYGIQSAIREAATELDWLAGDEDYKLAWTDRVRQENEVLFSRNWRGGFWIRFKCFEELLKPRIRHLISQSPQG